MHHLFWLYIWPSTPSPMFLPDRVEKASDTACQVVPAHPVWHNLALKPAPTKTSTT